MPDRPGGYFGFLTIQEKEEHEGEIYKDRHP